MREFAWESLSLVVEENHDERKGKAENWAEMADTLTELAEQESIVINHLRYYEGPYVPSEENVNKLKKIIWETHESTRVYLFLGELDALIVFVRQLWLNKISTTGEYQVIAVQVDPYDPLNKNKYVITFLEDISETGMGDLVDAFKPVMMLMPRVATNPRYGRFIQETRNYSVAAFNLSKSPLPDHVIPVPIYAAYLYDAINLYARALDETLLAGGDPRDGHAIMSRIFSREYDSIQGYRMYIDSNGDAEANYTVVALKGDPENVYVQKSMTQVGYFQPSEDGSGIPTFHYLEDQVIDWILGGPPLSQPKCGFDGSLCVFEPNWAVAVAFVVCAIAIVIATIFACRHYIYEQKLASLPWKIEFKDLLLAEPDPDPTLSEKTKRKAYTRRVSYISTRDSREDSRTSRTFTRVASYKGGMVAVKILKKRHVEINRTVKKELHLMKELTHDNINRFIGACVESPDICIVTQYCSRGSLKDILENPTLNLDDMFVASLVSDLIKGMIYLHDGEIGSHGNLKPSNCLVDSRWVLQITDFGLHHFKAPDVPILTDENAFYEKLLWRAPELLRDPCFPPRGTPKGDVYSFAIILYEIHGRAGPWGHSSLSAREIIENVKETSIQGPFRPALSKLPCEEFIIKCIQECWQEDPDFRPDFKYIRVRLKPMQKGLRSNIFDNMIMMLEKYATNLEAVVEERTNQLAEEKAKTEALLHRMLPPTVADQLKRGKAVVPEQYDCVTIYFSDVVGFTSISADSTPMQVVDLLSDLYTMFDSIIENYDVYKVETIGDAYMVVSGLPIRNGINHAGEIASMSLHLLSAIKDFRIRHRPNETLKLRIGMHSGPVVAGVVGQKMPRYCLFGDTVNTTSRMETTGVPLKIHCSGKTKQLLSVLGGYQLEERGPVLIKGKGEMFTFFLVDEDRSQRLGRIYGHSNKKHDSSCCVCLLHNHQHLSAPVSRASSATFSSQETLSAAEEEIDAVQLLLNGRAHFAKETQHYESVI